MPAISLPVSGSCRSDREREPTSIMCGLLNMGNLDWDLTSCCDSMDYSELSLT